MLSAMEARNHSYEVRRQIAAIVGAPESTDFSTEILVQVQMPHGILTATLTSTSNAGFNGINGSFRTVKGDWFSRSLGHVLAYEDAGKTVKVVA